ncbi:hypothetical protein P280DRAFT_467458 [Massarina eburnea CBS 473.64]|uniref:Uncharacterized protein n=1 Tax=Massarina eburnea CBS 473.64 TaxID=1395130 RepID=A0A6A6SAI2_9PLEO|nr:hypothetical protein P280DRAFT_467458 [Massarina eburnea CBS 473.64]
MSALPRPSPNVWGQTYACKREQAYYYLDSFPYAPHIMPSPQIYNPARSPTPTPRHCTPKSSNPISHFHRASSSPDYVFGG